jgi:hypothetical protein
LNTSNQAFVITYRDSNFLAVPDALVQISRKYIDEGIFKTIEQPLTDSNGQTVGNLVLNNVIYNFIVTKNGQVLSSFNNYLAKCQNPIIQTCAIDLTTFSESPQLVDFATVNDFAYTLTYDNTSRIVSSTFNVPSGSVNAISLNVSTTDALGSSICSQLVTTSSGIVSCVVPSTFGNGTFTATLYKNGLRMGGSQISLQETPSQIYGGAMIILAILIFLTLIGAGMSDNPIFTVLFMLVGVIMLIALGLVGKKVFIGGTATILFLVVAIIILLVKAGRRN